MLLELDPVRQGERFTSRYRLFREQIEEGLPVFQPQMLERGAARVDATHAAPVVAEATIALLAM